MSLGSNLSHRLRLLRNALTRRFIWADLAEMMKAHGMEMREVRGNTHPLRLSALVGGTAPLVDFSALRSSAADFRADDGLGWNSEPSVGEFLGELAARMRPAAVAEIGCYLGWTSAHLAAGLAAAGGGGRLWCVDSDRAHLESARRNLTRLGLAGRVDFLPGLSLETAVLDRLPARLDFIFLDTTHDFEDTRREIAAYAPRLSPGGILALHDTIGQPGARKAVLEVWERFDTTTFATEGGNGLTVLRRR